jgi:hypothetical protein
MHEQARIASPGHILTGLQVVLVLDLTGRQIPADEGGMFRIAKHGGQQFFIRTEIVPAHKSPPVELGRFECTELLAGWNVDRLVDAFDRHDQVVAGRTENRRL